MIILIHFFLRSPPVINRLFFWNFFSLKQITLIKLRLVNKDEMFIKSEYEISFGPWVSEGKEGIISTCKQALGHKNWNFRVEKQFKPSVRY